ncbi:Calcium-dependent lipid-binding domain-containing protein [Quillaja saponaria]|uniref:Calcium-dependent lipid-binding domain-containing protein n=1 Tax=Quillaja saponaria TaxID=32244 RepID=A0AAD7LSU7_QUISA|nr:Calcium-dependent lipid-binding domain-containing protein [Quillaja saponaria]KAJ7963696.1 Calcium-dependent lipid-binding domain-containing protein [Quillaja saponaria]
MDSPQSVVSPFQSSVEVEKQKSDSYVWSSSHEFKGTEVNGKEGVMSNLEDLIGVLDVYVHQARNIQNICIYHKQDVYAKLCLTSNPENTISTKTINGGGRNPVFNDNLRLNVRTVDSSLKCEIWMLSRVRNYLEDQLLGFALVPLSEVLMKNGKLEKEFTLSSTDLFHSPSGFVQLSLSYNGTSPDVMAIPALSAETTVQDIEISESLPSELDKIEFPDPKVVNEDQLMISEYFGFPCSNLDSQSSDSLVTSDAEDHLSSEAAGVRIVESFSTGSVESVQLPKPDSPPSSVSTNGVSSPSLPANSESSDAAAGSKSPTQEQVSSAKEKTVDVKDGESNSSNGVPCDTSTKPIVSVNIEPEQNVVQQDIVDMYMKSMQQFTESLAKMKLPLDIETGPASSGNSSSDQKLQASKNNGSRVFYGSRAFF